MYYFLLFEIMDNIDYKVWSKKMINTCNYNNALRIYLRCYNEINKATDTQTNNKINNEEYKYANVFDKNNEDFIKEFKNFLDWKVISMKKLGTSFMAKYSKYIDWEIISEFQYIDCALLEKFSDNINWTILIKKNKLHKSVVKYILRMCIKQFNFSIYDEYKKVYDFQRLVMMHQNIPFEREFINEIKPFLDWDIISEYQTLGINALEIYKSYINWEIACCFQTIPNEFICRNISILNWKKLVKYQSMTIRMLREFQPYEKTHEMFFKRRKIRRRRKS